MAVAAGKVFFRPKDSYSAESTYEILDFVTYQGSSYVAKKTTVGNPPTDSEYWQLLASGAEGGGGASYGVSDTDGATATKDVDCYGFTLTEGAEIIVRFTQDNTAPAGSLALNVASTGAKYMRYRNGSIPSADTIAAGRTYAFIYDGTAYQLVGDLGTAYAPATQSEDGLMASEDKTKLDGLDNAEYDSDTETITIY